MRRRGEGPPRDERRERSLLQIVQAAAPAELDSDGVLELCEEWVRRVLLGRHCIIGTRFIGRHCIIGTRCIVRHCILGPELASAAVV